MLRATFTHKHTQDKKLTPSHLFSHLLTFSPFRTFSQVKKLTSELQYRDDEANELRARVGSLGGDVESVERLHQQQVGTCPLHLILSTTPSPPLRPFPSPPQLAKEREERVEMLRRQIVRRVMNSALSSGWSSWVDFWR